jgi:hypothetical protein
MWNRRQQRHPREKQRRGRDGDEHRGDGVAASRVTGGDGGRDAVVTCRNDERLLAGAVPGIIRVMRRTRCYRLGLVLTALFQLLLPTFASVADARAEAAAEQGAYAHVEEHSSSHCVPVHPADCAICRVIGSGATVHDGPALLAPAVRLIGATLPQYERLAPAATALRRPSQRAPPIA